MTTTHTDVTAVGPISESTPFIMAGVISHAQYTDNYNGASNDNTDGYGYAPMVGIFNASGNLVNIAAVEAATGSMLYQGTSPVWGGPNSTLTTKMLYWRINRVPMNGQNYSYRAFANNFVFYAYTSPAADAINLLRDPTTNLPLNLTFKVADGSNVLALMPGSTASPLAMQLAAVGPNNYPDFPNLQAGMKYSIVPPSSSRTNRVYNPYSRSAPNLVPETNNYGGLPYLINEKTVFSDGTGRTIQIDNPKNLVYWSFWPVTWIIDPDNCTGTTGITTTNFAPAAYHLCDRWSALAPKATSTSFYNQICEPALNSDTNRGNTTQYMCQAAKNALYYPSDDGSTCGQPWKGGTTYTDMTDKAVSATSTMGWCDTGVCAIAKSGGDYVCLQLDATGSHEPPDPPDDFCATCLTDFCGTKGSGGCPTCDAIKPVCDVTSCPTQLDPKTNCQPGDNPGPPWLGWILIGALILFIIILLIVHVRQRSKVAEADPRPQKSLIPTSGDELEEIE